MVAGVPRTILITPPGPDGKVDAATLIAAQLIGIKEVYKCGGAQGIAAVAFGTQTVPKCVKVVGPGSPWVVAAKRLLSDVIDPGIPAGPSESIILADDSANAAVAALDLLIEAEHGPDSSVYLVTDSRRVVDAVLEALPVYWKDMDARRVEFSRAVLTGTAGGIVLTRDLSESIAFVNDFAPEHLEVLCAEPMDVLARIRNAGEVLLGPYTPITLGNYLLGPNAVLPTARHARTASALSVYDFMKRISVGYVTRGRLSAPGAGREPACRVRRLRCPRTGRVGAAPEAPRAVTPAASPSARALEAARGEDWPLAQGILTELIGSVFALRVASLDISRDRYSLNSVNGFVRLQDGREYFFKFHHEEGEEVTLQEFYRGELLQRAGFPVDVPEFVSQTIGSQMLMYRRRSAPRVADLCERLDFEPLAAARPLLDAQSALDSLTNSIYLRTLHLAAPAAVAKEPINQLFHHRLIAPGHPEGAGGRARQFFWNRTFDVAGTLLTADELRSAAWVVNGIAYRDTIDSLLSRSRRLLEPARLAAFGAVTAHGDSHNANVWWDEQGGAPRLVFFDPAFAGDHVSALLAEVKATFHNIFAHPLWLYHAAAATNRYRASSSRSGAVLRVDSDWKLSPLREEFLAIKAERLWRPLLLELRRRGLLPDDWRATLRCALFCCLRAGHGSVRGRHGWTYFRVLGHRARRDGGDGIGTRSRANRYAQPLPRFDRPGFPPRILRNAALARSMTPENSARARGDMRSRRERPSFGFSISSR